MWYKDDVFKVRFLEVYAFEVCVFVVCVFEVCVFEVCVFEVCVLEVCGLWSAFSRSVFSRHPPVFLGITLIDSFTNEHSWRKIVQKQTEINFYSSCPFKVEYFTCICSLSIYSLCISAPFRLRYNWHAWCFLNVNSVSFWGIFRSSSNEIEKNLFDVGTDDFKVERRSNENASKVNLWSGLHMFVRFNFCS